MLTNSFFEVVKFFCELDHTIWIGTNLRQHKAQSYFMYLINIHIMKRTLCGIYDLSLKKHIRKFRNIDVCHQQTIRRIIDASKRWIIQKAMFRKVTTRKLTLMNHLTLKASSLRFKDHFQKSNLTRQDLKEALISLKSWCTINSYFSPFMIFLLAKKESNFFSV